MQVTRLIWTPPSSSAWTRKDKKAALREAKEALNINASTPAPDATRETSPSRPHELHPDHDDKDVENDAGDGLPRASTPRVASHSPSCPAKESVQHPWHDPDWKSQEATEVQCVEYDMEEFFQSCVQRYADMTRTDPETYPKVPTPFGVEDPTL